MINSHFSCGLARCYSSPVLLFAKFTWVSIEIRSVFNQSLMLQLSKYWVLFQSDNTTTILKTSKVKEVIGSGKWRDGVLVWVDHDNADYKAYVIKLHDNLITSNFFILFTRRLHWDYTILSVFQMLFHFTINTSQTANIKDAKVWKIVITHDPRTPYFQFLWLRW